MNLRIAMLGAVPLLVASYVQQELPPPAEVVVKPPAKAGIDEVWIVFREENFKGRDVDVVVGLYENWDQARPHCKPGDEVRKFVPGCGDFEFWAELPRTWTPDLVVPLFDGVK